MREEEEEEKGIKIWTLLTWTRKLKHCGGRSGGNISVQILVVVERGLVVHQRGGPQLLLGIIKNVFFFHGKKNVDVAVVVKCFFLSPLSAVKAQISATIRGHYVRAAAAPSKHWDSGTVGQWLG